MTNKRPLILLLMMALLLPSAAHAQPGPLLRPGMDVAARFDPPPRDIQALAAWQGGLYFSDYNRLYALLPGGAVHTIPLDDILGKPEAPSYRAVRFVQGENSLALLDTQSGLMVLMALTGDKPKAGRRLQLDWSDYVTPMPGYTQVEPPSEYALAEGKLFALDGPGAQLSCFDLADGQRLPTGNTAALRIAPYQDGQLLMVVAQPDDGQGPAKRAIASYQPSEDKLTFIQPLAEAPGALGHISYEAGSDSLLIVQGDAVYSYQHLAEGRPCAQMPVNDGYQERLPLAALPGGLLAVSARSGLFIKAADPLAFANKTPLSLMLAVDNPQGLN